MALASTACQCEGVDDMARFANGKKTWLKDILKLPHGTQSNDNFRRVFSSINPGKFNASFMVFTPDTHGELAQQLISIDGEIDAAQLR